MTQLKGQPDSDHPHHLATPMSGAELWIRTLRTCLQLIPYGIGSALDSAVFGTADDLRLKRLESFLTSLAQDIRQVVERLGPDQRPHPPFEFFRSDEFQYVFEGVLRRVNAEVAQAKLEALRGVLVSVIVHGERTPFEKQSSFLKTIDLLEPTHIRVLQLLVARSDRAEAERFLSHHDICGELGARVEADVNFVYSAIDTLANREFILSGPIPFDANGRLAKERQCFRATALGCEFLNFIRMARPTGS